MDVRASKVLEQILNVLKREGFIRTYKSMGETAPQRMLRIYLKYAGRRPAIAELIRISTPGKRTYRNAKTLPRVLRGLGVAIISTSKGMLTDRDAYRDRIGGEVVCYVW